MSHTQKRSEVIEEMTDLELNCKNCGTRLYAPVLAARQVVTTVQSGGTAWLICPYGHLQYIRQKRQKTHD
jgi:hypothetical protein